MEKISDKFTIELSSSMCLDVLETDDYDSIVLDNRKLDDANYLSDIRCIIADALNNTTKQSVILCSSSGFKLLSRTVAFEFGTGMLEHFGRKRVLPDIGVEKSCSVEDMYKGLLSSCVGNVCEVYNMDFFCRPLNTTKFAFRDIQLRSNGVVKAPCLSTDILILHDLKKKDGCNILFTN